MSLLGVGFFGWLFWGLGRWIGGLMLGLLAGLIIGFVVGKGYNPLSLLMGLFTRKSE